MITEEEYTEHMKNVWQRVAKFRKPVEEKEDFEDPWTEEAVRIVGERICDKILAREKRRDNGTGTF